MLQQSLQSIRRYLLDRMVLRPSRDPIECSTQQRVLLQWRDQPLECFVQKNFEDEDPPDLLVLKFPGTGGRAERSSKFPLSLLPIERTTIWTWNPPGYGGSQGRASLSNIAESAIEFWEQVTARQLGQMTSVWLCGNSLGCVTALHVAATAQLDSDRCGMVLRNPPALRAVIRRVADRYPHFGLANPVINSLCDSMNAMHTAGQVDLPAVILQSELDTLVPLSVQNELIDAYAGPHQAVLMDGLGHGCIATEDHERQIEASLRWLWMQTEWNSNEPNDES